tara:strand:- start:29073 stop:29327 length:255 start_codon:yes stop_codon:yes gene_type:complete
MLDKLKDLWSKWKVHVTVTGGIVAVATAYGTCIYEPPAGAVSDVETTTSTTEAKTAEVSATTTGTTDNDGTEDNTTGNTPTITE